jgi:hypothetical protein
MLHVSYRLNLFGAGDNNGGGRGGRGRWGNRRPGGFDGPRGGFGGYGGQPMGM